VYAAGPSLASAVILLALIGLLVWTFMRMR